MSKLAKLHRHLNVVTRRVCAENPGLANQCWRNIAAAKKRPVSTAGEIITAETMAARDVENRRNVIKP